MEPHVKLKVAQSPPSSGSSKESPVTFEHPLLNPLIVDLIVEHLDPNFDQLKTLRLVSKVWTQATLKHWRKSGAVLTLVPDPLPVGIKTLENGVSVNQFFSEFQDPHSPFQFSQKPFSKYKLKGFTLNWQECSDPESSPYKFWNSIGPLMESVHFYKCLFETPGDNLPNSGCPRVKFLVEILPDLKHLVLTDMTTEEETEEYLEDNDTSEDEEIQVFGRKPLSELRTLTIYGDLKRINMSLSELLTLAPRLEVFKGADQIWVTLLKPIHRARYHSKFEPRPLSNLKHLDLINSTGLQAANYPWDVYDSPIPPDGALIGSQFPLETLGLQLGALDEDTANLEIYLKSLSSTLKTFKALRAPAGPPLFDFLPRCCSMTNLTELYLWGTIAPNFGFLRSFPKLKKLQIDLGCFEKREEMKVLIERIVDSANYFRKWKYEKYNEDMVIKTPAKLGTRILCPDLEYLEIDYEFPENSLKILRRWMPNLKRLKTILNVATIPVVCQAWRGLTELVCLHGSKIENYCFFHIEKLVYFPWGPPEYKICDLKELERFQLDAFCDDCDLTDDVVYNGFLKMPALKSIKVCVNSQMSVEAEEALKKGIQFCTVDRDDHDDCGGSPLLGSGSFLCDRCTFRRQVIYGVRRVKGIYEAQRNSLE